MFAADKHIWCQEQTIQFDVAVQTDVNYMKKCSLARFIEALQIWDNMLAGRLCCSSTWDCWMYEADT